MAFLTQSVGPYTATFDAVTLGDFEGSIREQFTAHGQPVRASRFGESIIDGVYRGGDCFVLMSLKEWIAGTLDAMHPFDANMGESGVIGRLMSDIAAALVLTAVTATPAAATGPATRTYSKALFTFEHSREIVFGSEERNVPVTFIGFPTEQSATTSELTWFTDT